MKSLKENLDLIIWIALCGLMFFMHESWRDEAQAWLVAKSSTSFSELWYRSSLEATGPVYYLLLWPASTLFPEHYRLGIWLSSMTGSLLALLLLRKCMKGEDRVATLLLIFGCFVGYELLAVSRLYGWGLFFVLGLYLSHKNGRKWLAALFLFLASLTQLSLVFAVLLILSKDFFAKGLGFLKENWPLLLSFGIAIVIAYFHQEQTKELREWSEWGFPKKWSTAGSSMATPFLNTNLSLGYAGFLIFAFALFITPHPLRLPLLLGTGCFLLVFLGHYGHYAGAAKARHAGALHVIWALLFIKSFASLPKWRRISLMSMLGLSALFSAQMLFRDCLRQYSDQEAIAEKIRSLTEAEKASPFIYLSDEIYGSVIASVLTEPIYSGGDFKAYFYPQFTKENLAYRIRHWNRVPWEKIRSHCLESNRRPCAVVARAHIPPPREELGFNWEYKASDTVSDESLNLFVLSKSVASRGF